MFNSIIKPKKSKLLKIPKSMSEHAMHTMEPESKHMEMKEETMPKEKYEISEKKETYSKPKSETMSMIDMKMQKYKKKK